MVRIIVSTEDPTLNLATFSNAPENGMFSVKPLSRSQCYEKLTSICIFSRIGHWKDTCTCMFQFWVDLEKKIFKGRASEDIILFANQDLWLLPRHEMFHHKLSFLLAQFQMDLHLES